MKKSAFQFIAVTLLTVTCVFSFWTSLEARKAAMAAESAADLARASAEAARSQAFKTSEQASEAKRDAESAKEAAQRAVEETEQIRKAADEALKKITLYKDYKQGISQVRNGYLAMLEVAEQDFLKSLDEQNAMVEQRFIQWASEEDSFIRRLRFSRAASTSDGMQMAKETLRELLSLGWTPFSNQQERKISSGMRE